MNLWSLPDLPLTDPVLQFTVLVAVALVVQLTVERLRLPGLVGLLIVGMFIGPGGYALLPREPVVELLGQVGLVYVMFMAGLEINLDIVRQHRRETGSFGLAAFLLSLAPAVVLGLVIGLGWQAALLLGTLLSSHTLLAYPVVRDLGLLRRLPVVAAVGGTIVTDTLALLLLAIVIQAGGDNGGVLAWLMPLGLLALLTVASLYGLPRLARIFLNRSGATQAEKALFILVVLLVLSSAAELIGTEKILGAFLAGVSLNRVLERREVLREHVEFVGTMLFIPFFFISTGMLLELEVFTGQPRTWLVAGILVAVVFFGKGAASWLVGWWYGHGWTERMLMTSLTVPQAAATLAVTVIARQAGLFEEELVDAVIILIFVTCLAGPVLTHYFGRRIARDAPPLN